jgi:hypothetical protein
MTVRSIRIPDDLDRAITFVAEREKIERSQSLRKLAALGFERYVASLYEEGRVTAREAAALLETSLRQALERFDELGVPGNVRATDVLRGLDALRRVESTGDR